MLLLNNMKTSCAPWLVIKRERPGGCRKDNESRQISSRRRLKTIKGELFLASVPCKMRLNRRSHLPISPCALSLIPDLATWLHCPMSYVPQQIVRETGHLQLTLHVLIWRHQHMCSSHVFILRHHQMCSSQDIITRVHLEISLYVFNQSRPAFKCLQ